MIEVIPYDGDGVQIEGLFQWDNDVYVNIKDPDIGSAFEVHYFNQNSDEALVVASKYSDGVLQTKIPNSLLRVPYPVCGCVFVDGSDGSARTMYVFKITVRARPKPADYVHEDTPDYVDVTKAVGKCKEYAANAEQSASDAADSATLSESYAVGGTGTRDGEDTDNSKYYASMSSDYADASAASAAAAEQSELNAAESESNAATSEKNAASSAEAAATSETNAANSESAAAASEASAADSASAAAASETNAAESEANAASSAESASTSATNAANSESAAATSESNAAQSADSAAQSAEIAQEARDEAVSSEESAKEYAETAKEYAIGDTESAKYYYELTKNLEKDLNIDIIYMGNTTFADLPSDAVAGELYNVTDEFVTTSDFVEGDGYVVYAGSNVIMTDDGLWDVLGGVVSPDVTESDIAAIFG